LAFSEIIINLMKSPELDLVKFFQFSECCFIRW